jgi:hypothetical protein
VCVNKRHLPAGPKSVAPVSRPATATMAECIRCSMNGRAMTMNGLLSPLAAVERPCAKSISVARSAAVAAAVPSTFLPALTLDHAIAAATQSAVMAPAGVMVPPAPAATASAPRVTSVALSASWYLMRMWRSDSSSKMTMSQQPMADSAEGLFIGGPMT